MGPLSHFDDQGASRMVDVSAKPVTPRTARARAWVQMAPATLDLIRNRRLAKGDVFEVARLAGILGAKQTSNLIPLCHPIALDAVSIDFDITDNGRLEIRSQVQVTARTGVEMEALLAVLIAALTVYDMCKAVDRQMVVGPAQLEEKTGGCSGHFVRASEASPAAPPD